MSNRRLLGLAPHNFSRKDVIDSIGNSHDYRNPFRVDLANNFPQPVDQRARDYADFLKTQDKGMAKKGEPL